MSRIVLPKLRLIQFAGNGLTEHNRDPLTMSANQIESKNTMADGTLRKYFVVSKKTFNVDWQNVPATSSHTVDGLWGAIDIQNFYYNTPGAFTLTLTYGTGTVETRTVMFSSFENDLIHRGKDDFYNLTIGLEEV